MGSVDRSSVKCRTTKQMSSETPNGDQMTFDESVDKIAKRIRR